MITTTLTDRYVNEALRRLPAERRPDIERELRASIADAVDDRLHAGPTPRRPNARYWPNSATRPGWPPPTRTARCT